MAWLIMNDEVDYPCEYYPTHILTEDRDVVPVFLGATSAIEEVKAIGIYVREEDYLKINHKKAYIFVHDPDVEFGEFEDLDWDQVPDQEDSLSANREHLHVWRQEDPMMEEATEEDQKLDSLKEKKNEPGDKNS